MAAIFSLPFYLRSCRRASLDKILRGFFGDVTARESRPQCRIGAIEVRNRNSSSSQDRQTWRWISKSSCSCLSMNSASLIFCSYSTFAMRSRALALATFASKRCRSEHDCMRPPYCPYWMATGVFLVAYFMVTEACALPLFS